MRKDEHLKIVKEFEDKIQDLEKEILELKSKNTKSEFDSKLNRFIADQRHDVISEVMSKNINNINYMKEYDKRAKEFYKNSMERINLDDEKFGALRDYIRITFPSAIVEMKPEDMHTSKKKDLSHTFIGEQGEIYKPYHVVDLAMMIMKTQKEKLNELLGNDDFDINDINDIGD